MPRSRPSLARRAGRLLILVLLMLAAGWALRDPAIDLVARGDEIRRTTAGPVEAIEIGREGPADAPRLLTRGVALGAGYEQVVVDGRRYRAGPGDGWFAAPPGAEPRWLVVERHAAQPAPRSAWSWRLRRQVELRIVDRERGETIARWPGPRARGGDDGEQAAAFLRSVLPSRTTLDVEAKAKTKTAVAQAADGPSASSAAGDGDGARPDPRLRPFAYTKEPPRDALLPASKVQGCPPGTRVVDAVVPDAPAAQELLLGAWVYGVPRRIASVLCAADRVHVDSGGAHEHVIDRLLLDGSSGRRILARGTEPEQQEWPDGDESRLVEAGTAQGAIVLRKRFFSAEPPHRAVRDVVIESEVPPARRSAPGAK